MKKWFCTICQYVHEGDEPPVQCPVCGAPKENFERVGGKASAHAPAPDDGPLTLEKVRDRARDALRGVCAVYPNCDGLGDHICQRETYGQKIGLGGVGLGGSFAANSEALAAVRLQPRLVGEHFEPDTSIEFLGQTLAMPILGSSTAGLGGHQVMDETTFCQQALQGCLDAGTLGLRGDTEGYSPERHPGLDALEALGGKGIPILKPRSQEVLKGLIERAQTAGCPAVGVDLDGCGSTNMARAGQPVFRKSVAEIRELVEFAGLPFIAKGIMTPQDAEACAEAGVAVVAVSNHGGRVLDSTPGVAEVLPAIAERVGGRVTLTADGGVRTGFDVLKLLALGANAVLIGRDLIRATIGAGPAGVVLQLEQLQKTLARAMLLTGCRTVNAVDAGVLYDPLPRR